MGTVAEPAGVEQLGSHEQEGEELDPRYEFNAPRFYDFDEGSPTGVAADDWFDTEGPKGLTTPQRIKQDQQQQPLGQAATKKGKQALHGAASGHYEKGKVAGGPEPRKTLGSITNTIKGQPVAAPPPTKQQTKRKAASGKLSAHSVATGENGQEERQQAPHQDVAAARTVQGAAASARFRAEEQQTSELLELEQVQREKEAADVLRRKNAAAVKHVLQAPAPAVAHSSRPLTEPVPLELNTSKRHRVHSMETRSMNSPYKSMAEQIAAFEGRMPSKSRLAAGRSSGAEAAPKQQRQQAGAPGGMAALTVPMSPQFATKRRVRPPRFKPREVVEEEEMAAMPKFKARPVNKRILHDQSGQLGVPHIDTKPPTVPEPFALKTDQRAAEHGHAGGSSSDGGGTAVIQFEAQGDGGRVTRSKAGKKKSVWTGQLTHPEPFALATEARGANKRSAAAEPQQEVQHVRPNKRRKAVDGPFELATEQRGAVEEARIEAIRQQQEEQARREAEFKALPLNKAALAGAWKPPPVAQPELTVPEEVALHSQARAAQRRQFDEAVAAHVAELEAEQRRLQQLQQQREEEEVKAMRKKQVHKALPLPRNH